MDVFSLDNFDWWVDHQELLQRNNSLIYLIDASRNVKVSQAWTKRKIVKNIWESYSQINCIMDFKNFEVFHSH